MSASVVLDAVANAKASPGKILSVTLAAGAAAAARAEIADSTTTTTPQKIELAAATGQTASWRTGSDGIYCGAGIRLSVLSGTGAHVTIEDE